MRRRPRSCRRSSGCPTVDEERRPVRGSPCETSPLATASETLYADLALEPGGGVRIEASHDERARYLVHGAVRVAGDAFEPGQMVVLRRGSAVVLKARDRPVRVMLFGAEPMGEARYIWWNFISSRKERIEQAKAEWAAGKPKRAEGAVHYP